MLVVGKKWIINFLPTTKASIFVYNSFIIKQLIHYSSLRKRIDNFLECYDKQQPVTGFNY